VKEIDSIDLTELSDDIINMEFIDESDLMVISTDNGKILIFDKYSKIANNQIINNNI
jgi:hypothetical protein